jgi:hypothetical protein
MWSKDLFSITKTTTVLTGPEICVFFARLVGARNECRRRKRTKPHRAWPCDFFIFPDSAALCKTNKTHQNQLSDFSLGCPLEDILNFKNFHSKQEKKVQ